MCVTWAFWGDGVYKTTGNGWCEWWTFCNATAQVEKDTCIYEGSKVHARLRLLITVHDPQNVHVTDVRNTYCWQLTLRYTPLMVSISITVVVIWRSLGNYPWVGNTQDGSSKWIVSFAFEYKSSDRLWPRQHPQQASNAFKYFLSSVPQDVPNYKVNRCVMVNYFLGIMSV